MEEGERSVALITREAGLAERLAACAEAEGWRPILSPWPMAPAEARRLGLAAAAVDAGLLGSGLHPYLAALRTEVERMGLVVHGGGRGARERILALRSGADFYAPGATDPVELMTLVVVAVRGRRDPPDSPITVGDLRLEPGRVFVGGSEVELTRLETRALRHLLLRPGVCVGREEIYRAAWGREMSPGDRAVDSLVNRLRRKLASVTAGGGHIHTRYGVGYRFDGSSSSADEEDRFDALGGGAPARRGCAPTPSVSPATSSHASSAPTIGARIT